MKSFAAALLLLLLSFTALVSAWTKEDHEIFRLRDEVEINEGEGVTFYDFIGLKTGPASTADDISRAYRKTSRALHPDKHKPAPHLSPAGKRASHKKASERFQRLGLIAKILRGPERDRYDHFLKNGFPKWRGSGYYYARFRPGLGSVLVGLWIVVGLVQYGVQALEGKRRRSYVERVIRDVRRSAGVDGLDAITGMWGMGEVKEEKKQQQEEEGEGRVLNRKERRAQKKAGGGGGEGTMTPPPMQVQKEGGKKKVIAENGKQFVVSQSGDVYLVAEDEDGEVQELLLDPEEVEGASWKRLVWVTLPMWIWGKTVGRVIGGKKVEGEGELEEEVEGEADEEEKESRRKEAKDRAERRQRVRQRKAGRG